MKTKTIGQLKKQLWKVFSLYIRLKDADWRGDVRCYTCDRLMHYKQAQAGHCIPRANCGLNLYFDEMNVKPQCFRCNINLGGNGAEFHRRLIKEYGAKKVEEMFKKKQTGVKWSKKKYLEKIEYYKKKLKELNK